MPASPIAELPINAPSGVTVEDEGSIRAALRGAQPFADLCDDDIVAIEQISYERSYQAGETLYSMGQFDGSEFILVQTGAMKVSYADPVSGEMLIDHYNEDAVFGLAQTVAEGKSSEGRAAPSSLTLMASAELSVVAIDADAFRQLVLERASITRNLMIYFAERLAAGGGRSASDASPERSVYATLLRLVVRDAASGDWRIDRMPKHRELAEQAGAQEPVAAQAIAKIIQEGVARRDYPGLIIDDMTALNRLAG